MVCSDVVLKLSEYVDGELSQSDMALVDDHLNDCSDCRSEVSQLRALSQAVAAMPEITPPAFLLARIEDATINKKTRRQSIKLPIDWLRIPSVIRFVAGLSAAGIIAVLFMTRPIKHEVVPNVGLHRPTVQAQLPGISEDNPSPILKKAQTQVQELAHMGNTISKKRIPSLRRRRRIEHFVSVREGDRNRPAVLDSEDRSSASDHTLMVHTADKLDAGAETKTETVTNTSSANITVAEHKPNMSMEASVKRIIQDSSQVQRLREIIAAENSSWASPPNDRSVRGGRIPIAVASIRF